LLQITATERPNDPDTPPKFSSEATVIINLIDKNDNTPKFAKGRYFANMSALTQPGTVLIHTHAVDADSGDFGKITYSLGQVSDL